MPTRFFKKNLALIVAIGLNIVLISFFSSSVQQQSIVSNAIDWSTVDLDSLPAHVLIEYFKWTNRSSCELINDFGGLMVVPSRNSTEKSVVAGLDGHKAICLDAKVAPPARRNCLVYSFGVNFDWSFDEDMEVYGCKVYSFDPSMNGVKEHNHTAGIYFYDFGLGSEDKVDQERNWTLKSLETVYEMLKPKHGPVPIDYLKVDIEYDEWTVLPQIIRSGMLDKVRQIGMEIHLLPNSTDTLRVDKLVEMAKTIRSLEDHGMIRFNAQYNPFSKTNFTGSSGLAPGYFGYEIAWYNSKFLL